MGSTPTLPTNLKLKLNSTTEFKQSRPYCRGLFKSNIHKNRRINGEWFRFSKKQVMEMFESLPESVRVFPSNSKNSLLSSFSNLERDCAENERISFRVRKVRGNFTPEEREERKQKSIQRKRDKKIFSDNQTS